MENKDSPDFNATRAEFFEAISHPARITILQTLSEKSMGFAELGRAVGIESGGHLQFHLNKLAHLVKTTPEGTYTLTGDGKEALWSINALRKSSNSTTTKSKEASVMHRNWAKPVLGGLMIALIVLGAFAGFQLQQMGGLGASLSADKDQIANLQSQIATLRDQNASLQSQLANLNSRMLDLTVQNTALSSLLSFNQKTIPVFASQVCKVYTTPFNGTEVQVNGFNGGILLVLTNVGNESVVFPASGVRILELNGTQALPTPGNNLTVYGFPSTSTCDNVNNVSWYSTEPMSTVTVPAESGVWIVIKPASLFPFPFPGGNYILAFANVTTMANRQVSVDPVWIYMTCVCG